MWLDLWFQNVPFLMVRPSDGGSINDQEFEGFIPDLLEHLSLLLAVDYNITLVRDDKYGSKNPDGTWNGMIGELLRGVRCWIRNCSTFYVYICCFLHPKSHWTSSSLLCLIDSHASVLLSQASLTMFPPFVQQNWWTTDLCYTRASRLKYSRIVQLILSGRLTLVKVYRNELQCSSVRLCFGR